MEPLHGLLSVHCNCQIHTLNAGQPSKGGREMSEKNKQSNTLLLDEDITRQELVWALRRWKGKAAPGKDGPTAAMINNVILVEFWYELFKLCWKERMVLSIWKQSVVIPVPKKRSKGLCITDVFRHKFGVCALQDSVYDSEGRNGPSSS